MIIAMRRIYVRPFVEAFSVDLPPVEEFWKLGDLTALRRDGTGACYRANYERGILLYALVARYRPTQVLEFGTGRGYGSLCMAWSMKDHAIPGRVLTIDMVPQHQPFPWLIDRRDGSGPLIEQLSRDTVWRKHAPESWLGRIVTLSGSSFSIMGSYKAGKIDMAFVDGGHDYRTVRHDFYSILEFASPRFGILYDDYAPTAGFGVQKLIDKEISPYLDPTLIYVDRCWYASGTSTTADPMSADPDYGMVWVHSDDAPWDIRNAYDPKTLSAFLRRVRMFESYREKALSLLKVLRRMFSSR
jgi:hypothetical protein